MRNGEVKPSPRPVRVARYRQRSQGAADAPVSPQEENIREAQGGSVNGKRPQAISGQSARVKETIRLSPGQVNRDRLHGGFESNAKRLRHANPSTPERKPTNPG